MGEEPRVSRRDFLAAATWAIGVLMGAGIGLPAIAYIVGPALQEEQSAEWIRLGSTSKVELGIPTLFKVRIERQTGWIVNEEEISVYVLTENGRDFIAMSNICTHLGCRVRWIDEQNRFFCPCHNGIFDKEGQIVSGPIPRPLDQYEVKIEDERLFMRGA
jgi:menaquinol-cytochrome c reductase iron-sulfur subunit